MRRRVALIVLFQFCVQFIPLALAEDASSGALILPAASGAVLTEPIAGSGTAAIPPTTTSGTIVISSGSTIIAGSGAVATTPVIIALAPPVFPVKIVLTEVMWMGSNVSTADEWVELAAFSSGSAVMPRSVSGWTLVSVKAGVETTLARLPHIELSSGAAIVIANTHAATSRLLNEPAVVTTAMSLPNTQLLLRLKDASGAVVDEADDGIGVPFAGANPSGGAKASMERVDAWRLGNVSANWKTATLSLGFDDGPAIFGTPGTLGVTTSAPADGYAGSPSSSPSSSSSASSVLSASSSSSSVIVGVPVLPVQLPPFLRLTEVLANPPGVDTDEWLEIGSFEAVSTDLSEVAVRIGTAKFALSGTLQPGEHRRYGKLQTGLSLPNSSGFIELLWRDKVIDAWTYTETPEGVSAGRAQDGTVTPQCVPSPDLPNSGAPLDPQIVVQSSSVSAGKLSLNLEARVLAGSMAGAVCAWTYPDGFTSASCNPPSHSIVGPIAGDVFLSMHDACGNTMIQLLHIDVAGKLSEKDEAERGMVCAPSAFTGVVVSEVFPNPVGDDAVGEWIELANPTPDEKPLCGWSVDDGERGSDPYPLDRWQLHPGDHLLLEREETGVALNNDRDAVRLFSPLRQGGSGAYEIVRYEGSPEGQAYARRNDGAWLWTSEVSPGAENVFPEVRWPQTVTVRLVAAMPNPEGKDTDGGEWIELQNQTAYPLPLTGWNIETVSQKLLLDGIILAPHQQKRIEDVPTLANTHGFLRLIDRDGTPQSTVAWATAKDGVAVERPTPLTITHDIGFDDDLCSSLSGISFGDNLQCVDSLSALFKEKKFDLQKYSSNNDSSTLFVGGTDVAEILLRQGMALVDEASPTPYLEVYRHAETEARENRRGIWANNDQAKAIDDARFMASVRSVLASDGLVIKPSKPSGIVSAGETILLSVNVPASIEVAFGTGIFQPYAGPLTIEGDTDLTVRAISDVQTSSGAPLSLISFQSYAVLKSRYPSLAVSEVYSSPAKGESEWIELWNPTDERVSLLGWSVDDIEDGGSKPVTLGAGIVIEPNQRLLLSDLSIAWNNDGDSVRLIAPNGKVSDALAYGSVKAGHAVAAMPNGLCDTVYPTPGAENRCAQAPPKVAKKKTSKTALSKAGARKVRYRNMVADSSVKAVIRALFERLDTGRLTALPPVEFAIFWLLAGLFLCCTLWVRVKMLR